MEKRDAFHIARSHPYGSIVYPKKGEEVEAKEKKKGCHGKADQLSRVKHFP
jgi:hypothetical protein